MEFNLVNKLTTKSHCCQLLLVSSFLFVFVLLFCFFCFLHTCVGFDPRALSCKVYRSGGNKVHFV